MELSIPLKEIVGPLIPSEVWLKTTSRMTQSRPVQAWTIS
jgi:hypothetical protein